MAGLEDEPRGRADSTPPDPTPPEVPEEFAAAYRAAYERALAAQSDRSHRREPEPSDDDAEELPQRQGRLRLGTHRSPPPETFEAPPPRGDRPGWLVPVLLLVLVLLLVVGAYVVGRIFAGRVESPATSDDTTPASSPWAGTVRPVRDVRAEVACTSRPGTDASGAEVSYRAANMTDGRPETTWRCDGDATGRKVRLVLGGPTAVGEVGLVPGYAKTDEKSGEDRYAENNRITRVRWTIGSTVVQQRLDPDPAKRQLRVLRVPRTTADVVTLEILGVAKGPRNTTAISEVRIGSAG